VPFDILVLDVGVTNIKVRATGQTKLVKIPSGRSMQEPEGFNVCRESHIPGARGELPEILGVEPIIAQTPIPGLGEGKGALPRFRSEIGPFIGLSSAVRGTALGGGFGSTQSGVGTTGGLDAAVRLGLGLEGVLNESSDGQVFIDLGLREDSSKYGGASIPGRSALVVRWRVPIWLIPGDLIVATPVLAFTTPRKLKKMAMQSVNGGLVPWQTGIATAIGRFQFVLGREIGLNFYGYAWDQNVVIPTPGVVPVNQTVVNCGQSGWMCPFSIGASSARSRWTRVPAWGSNSTPDSTGRPVPRSSSPRGRQSRVCTRS
jgi:hypothetical protein